MSDKKLKIEVADTGIGMSEQEILELFINVLARSNDAKRVNVTGKGLGLYLSKRIIEAHNGKIWAESPGEGKGSTFYIELPIA